VARMGVTVLATFPAPPLIRLAAVLEQRRECRVCPCSVRVRKARPASVIVTRTISIVLSLASMLSIVALARPVRTTLDRVSTRQPSAESALPL
jgi:hypothetical protein